MQTIVVLAVRVVCGVVNLIYMASSSVCHLCSDQTHILPALLVPKRYTSAQMAQKVGHETDD